MSARPTSVRTRAAHRSARNRRRRRRRGALLALVTIVVVVAAVAAVWLARGDEGGVGAPASGSPAPSVSPSASSTRLSSLTDVEVHSGDKATIRYRVVAPGGTITAVKLVVTDAAGTRVKARRLADAPSGRWTSASVPIDLPAGRYTYALLLGGGPSTSPGQSPAPSATAELHVLAPLPPGFPGSKAVAATESWLDGRDGDVAYAVVDTNGEEAGGLNEHRTFQAASLAKAVLLVASLRDDPTPDAATETALTQMITESDNGAAYTIYGRVGTEGMRAVAEVAGMEDYAQGSDWLDTRVSAADAARFFYDLESLVPAEGRGLARRLLSGVVPIQRWGIPAAAGPEGWTTYFKSGWLGLDNTLMVQAAWLEKGKTKWALAVMSDDNPTRSYGWDTQKGTTGLLLGREPTPEYLAVVLE
jgi:hypothetical protein